MQRLITLLSFLCFTVYTQAQTVDIPDPDFLQFLIDEGVDTDGDGMIQVTEAEAITSLVSEFSDFFSMEGIKAFSNLEYLTIREAHGLNILDISDLSKLKVIDFSGFSLLDIQATGLTSLDSLSCVECHGLHQIELTGATSLKYLNLSQSQISDLDFTGLTSLETFDCHSCVILTLLNLQDANTLKTLILNESMISEIDASSWTSLEVLECEYCSFLSEVDLSGATELKELSISNSHDLYTLDVSPLVNLEKLVTNYNHLEVLDVADLTKLTRLECAGNILQELDVSKLVNLKTLDCADNEFIKVLDVSGMDQLEVLNCNANDSISVLDIADKINLNSLSCSSNGLTELDVSNLVNLEYLNCSFNEISELDLTNLVNLTTLSCNLNNISTLDLTNLNALTNMDIGRNDLGTVDLSGNPLLRQLTCHENQLAELDLSIQDSLTYLDCAGNFLTNIDVSHLSILQSLECGRNQMTDIDFSGMPRLDWIFCGQESLKSLNVSNSPVLQILEATVFPKGNLETIQFENCPMLLDMQLENLKLRSLDISQLQTNPHINVNNNELQTLYLKNDLNESIEFEANPNLYFICADDFEISGLENYAENVGLPNVNISSYCPHTNAGQPYVISGKNSFDESQDGCDDNDIRLPNLKFNISDGTVEGTIVSDESGDYSIHVHEGSHTITAILEDPDYFTVEPQSITIDFPDNDSPVTQDFCVTAIGNRDDVEVYIVPIDEARPGFDTGYKLIYRNKGNSVQSGTIQLFYQAMLMDLVNANPTVDMESGNLLFWNYTELKPYEQREISLTMGLNSPMDDPPINGDDILQFIASITLDNGDDIAQGDNQDVFRQVVVNSFDPNDKTCLNGAHIEPELVGGFVRYMIRFENTGTANAINIVVRDSIDPAVFDISTLVPIDASHDLRTQINEDIVEFIFADINLPFDDENNDGYVVFKVKTRPSLVLGDVLENTAAIYFDYNFPIITNTASTTVAIPDAVEDILEEGIVDIYPNPSKGILDITSEHKINSIKILNLQGKLIYNAAQITPSYQMHITLPKMATGMYLVQIYTEEGNAAKKLFIEQ